MLNPSANRHYCKRYLSLLCTEQRAAAAILPKHSHFSQRNCAGTSEPLNAYTWTESAKRAVSRGRQGSTMCPKLTGHGHIDSSDQWHWRQWQKPATPVPRQIHRDFLICLNAMYFLCMCIHTPGSTAGTDVLLFCIPAHHSWLDYPAPPLFCLAFNNQMDILH